MSRTLLIALASLATACRSSTGPALTGEPAGDAAASITYDVLQVAGGRPRVTVVTIDSATARWEEVACDGVERLSGCASPMRRSGSVPPSLMSDVWSTTASAEFRALGPTYGFSGGIVPPDVHSVRLTVVANGRRWRVDYDARAPLPGVLGRLDCRVQVARGSLISCA
jgi:hypothetical protein